MAIEKIYRVTVHFESPDDFDSSVTNEICYSNLTSNYNEFSGNAACNSYIEFECESLSVAKKIEASLINILKQNGCEIAN